MDKLLSGDDGGGIFDDPPAITDSVMMPPDHGDDDDDYDHLSRKLLNCSSSSPYAGCTYGSIGSRMPTVPDTT